LQRYRSLRDWFGAELRHWRELRELSQERLAARVHFGEDMIAKVEKAERWLSRDMATTLDEVRRSTTVHDGGTGHWRAGRRPDRTCGIGARERRA
jgi:transcriptional regulator with XRE-family HTH domain